MYTSAGTTHIVRSALLWIRGPANMVSKSVISVLSRSSGSIHVTRRVAKTPKEQLSFQCGGVLECRAGLAKKSEELFPTWVNDEMVEELGW